MTDAATARRAFLDALAEGESTVLAAAEGISPYFILCGGGSFEHLPGDAIGFPIWDGLQGPWGVSHAAGRWQFEPETAHAQFAKLGLKSFRDPASQDAAAWDLACTVYHDRTGRVLPDDLLASRLNLVATVLQSTWTSLSSATFAARYAQALAADGGSGGGGTTPPPAPTLADLVRDVQRWLQAAGYYRDVIDGDFGPESYAAIQAAQAAAG